MNIFYFKRQFFIFIVLLFIILIGLQQLNRRGKQDPLTSFSFQFFSEIQTASVNFQKGLSAFLKKYLFLLDLREQNTALRQENRKLRIKQQLFKEAALENERLKNIIDFPANQKNQLLAGKIISNDLLSKNHLFIINKGRSHGIKKMMGVVHPKGVVGYIFRTSPHSSQVITLLHPLSSLPVRNRNSRVKGLIMPTGNNQFLFDFWQSELFEDQAQKSFKPGDFIITVKSEQFPPGFLVGQVLPFSYSNSNLDVYVKPFVNFAALEEVFVVLKAGVFLEHPGEENEASN